MKKKTKKQKRRYIWLKHNQPLNLKTKQKKKLKKVKSNKVKKSKPNKNRADTPRPKIISLMNNINFSNIKNLINITQKIDKYLDSKQDTFFVIDHKKINNISIGGMLYLIGQIDKISQADDINLQYNKKYGLSKKNQKVRFLLLESGYWDYFNIKNPYYIHNERKNYFLSIESDTQSNIKSLNKVKQFISDNTQLLINYEFEYDLDDIIKEAMGNSIEHAYPEEFNEPNKEKGKWWICGHYDKIDQSLEIVLYDYGVGIRKSLEINLGKKAQRKLFNKTKDFLRTDSDLIEIAINGDLSKYKEGKDRDRGKGLKRFKKFAISINHDCELTISSGTGKYKMVYCVNTDNNIVTKESYRKSIDGMLVKWKIKKVQT